MFSLKHQFGNSGFVRFLREAFQRRRNLWAGTETVLLTGGMTLLAIYGGSQWYSRSQAKSALQNFTAASTAYGAASEGGQEAETTPAVDFNLWDIRRIEAYKESLSRKFDAPLAVLEIPKLHLQAPVFRGADDSTLDRGLGWIVGTARPGARGNVGIAGHREGFFRGLKDVEVGDVIKLKMLDRSDRYVVDRIQIVSPKQVSVLRERDVPSLTLVTCYPFYFVGRAPQRYIVSASLLEPTHDQPRAQKPSSANHSNLRGESHENR